MIDTMTDSNSAASLAASDKSNKRISQKDDLIKDLQNQVGELQKSEEAAKKLMSKMKVQNLDLVAKGRQAYKDVKQSQIVHEKEKYELYLKIKQQGHMVKQQKKDLEEMDIQLVQLKHQEAVWQSQKALAESG